MSLSDNLKKLRNRKGKSLQEVAEAVGVSKPHIWQLERGDKSNPSLELLRKLAVFYDTSISALIEEGEQRPMVFGREFKSEEVDEDTEKLIIQMAEKLIGKKDSE